MVYFKDSTSKQFWENKDNVAKRVQVVKRFLFWRYIKEDYLEGTMEQIIRWFRREDMAEIICDMLCKHLDGGRCISDGLLHNLEFRLTLPDLVFYEKKWDVNSSSYKYLLLKDTQVEWRHN